MTFITDIQNAVDANNSTTVTLTANSTFTGTSTDVVKYNSISINVTTDQNGLTDNSLVLEWSSDNVNWDLSLGYDTHQNISQSITSRIVAQYFRVKYNNGDTTQTSFRLQTMLMTKHTDDVTSTRTLLRSYGERFDVGTTAAGEDIWHGTATTIPTPPDVGEQMTVVSDDTNDTSAGTGAQVVRIHYLDASGLSQREDVTMNGTTGVNTTATDIRFVQEMHTIEVGSVGVAVGIITIFKIATPATIYNLITAGANMSLVINKMVPAGKYLLVTGWNTSVASKPTRDDQVSIRLRSTDHFNNIYSNVFIFKDIVQSSGGAIWKPFPVPFRVPPLSIIKVSAWASVSGADVSAGIEGYLVNNYDI